ncbi:hypothetical protein GPALN_007741 [Globodera pallida]|nr:hypothetical protein GPALN_007741 [Globodera pallida]
MKEDLALRFESILGTLYLLVENWHCDNILKQIRGDYERKECKKYRKYLNIAYEYLFRVFIKVADPELSERMPAVAPQFQYNTCVYSIVELINFLNEISNFYFNPKYSKKTHFKLPEYWRETTLVNEEALKMHQLKQNDQKKIEHKVPEDIRQQFVGNNSNTQIRKQFHELLTQMYETTVNKCKNISTPQYEQRDIYAAFLAVPFS